MDHQQIDQMRKNLWDWLESPQGRNTKTRDPSYYARSFDRVTALEQVVALHETNKKLDRIIQLLETKFGYRPLD